MSTSDFVLRGLLQRKATPVGYLAARVSDDGSLLAHPRYAELCARGQVFHASVAAVTLPVNVATLVSVFGIYNPPSSGVMMELIEAEAHAVVATTVVNGMGLYALGGQTGATFTTLLAAGIQSSRLTEGVASACRAYSAVTYVGTPILADLVGGWGAVTDGGATPIRKQWDGKIMIPPGVLASLAMTTAASTASGITALLRWAEVPYVAQ